jgi:F-type H+-transporting ATPase subunit delta
VADAFRAKRLEREGVVEGVLECPRPLDASELESLATSLGARLGKRVSLSARLNPDLVGGVRVFVGARMLDRSVQGRLEGLRRKMLAARLPVGAR